MSYDSQWKLANDDVFVSRCRAALIDQAAVYKDDARLDISGLGKDILRGAPAPMTAFQSLLATAPGFATNVDNGDGTIDSAKIDDAGILSAVQADWPVIANLYFNSDGTRVT